MEKISSPLQDIQPTYDVVVIGSGYGGSISASRLARAGKRVCLLERGDEILPGEYPETQIEALEQFQVDLPSHCHVGSKKGLYDFRLNPEMSVLVGCGLGGTSLINAGVSIRPDDGLFADPCWPKALHDPRELDAGYKLSWDMLSPKPYPKTFPTLPKMEAHRRSAHALGQELRVLDINVTFQDGPNNVGVYQEACKLCGNCVSGCNYLSKNTLLMNYLPDAKRHGAHIFCGAEVRCVEREGDMWLVRFNARKLGALELRAKVVILAAGTLGSTEILLRSKANGLSVSPTLGARFSDNGDMLSFAYNCEDRIDGLGWAQPALPGKLPVGPTITSGIEIRDPERSREVLLEEGAIPIPLVSFAELALFGVALAKGIKGPTPLPSLLETYRAERHTQTYLTMSLEGGSTPLGRIYLDKDRARITWPQPGDKPNPRAGSEEVKSAAEALGGAPWSKIAGERLLTVHPLGGCAMADDAKDGVVDDRCRVFSGAEGAAVHEGLYVCDGSVIPMPLGVNPLWTICAIAERACQHLAADRGWYIDDRLPKAAPPPPEATTVGIRFNEVLAGYFKLGVTDGYERGYQEGKAADSPFTLSVAIESERLDAMVNEPDHRAGLVGAVVAPALSPEPLMATGGVFNLFTQDGPNPNLRFMHYRAQLTTAAGERYYLNGFKRVGGGHPITEAWKDSTTLFLTVYRGEDETGEVMGKGIIAISPEDVLNLVASMRAVNARGMYENARAVLKFGAFFLGTEAKVYLGGLF